MSKTIIVHFTMLRKQSPGRKDEKATKELLKADEKSKKKTNPVVERTKADKIENEAVRKENHVKDSRERSVEKDKNNKRRNSSEENLKTKKPEEKPTRKVDVVMPDLAGIDPFEDRPKIPRTKDEPRKDTTMKHKVATITPEDQHLKGAEKVDAISVRRKTLEKVGLTNSITKGAGDKSSPNEKKQFTAFAEERKAKMRGDKPVGEAQRRSYGHVGRKQKRDSLSDEDMGNARERAQHRSDSLKGVRRDKSPVESTNLEVHAEAIRERRMSLPRTIMTDPTADVEILIGDDGKPIFHPTITPKTDEILRELTQLVMADESGDQRSPPLIPS